MMDNKKCQGQKNGKPCLLQLQPEFDHCPKCGTAVDVRNDPKLASQVIPSTFCPAKTGGNEVCGYPLRPEAKFCENCGWRINLEIFTPGAQMCKGFIVTEKRPCDNIVTPKTKFCSKCGTPPPPDCDVPKDKVDKNEDVLVPSKVDKLPMEELSQDVLYSNTSDNTPEASKETFTGMSSSSFLPTKQQHATHECTETVGSAGVPGTLADESPKPTLPLEDSTHPTVTLDKSPEKPVVPSTPAGMPDQSHESPETTKLSAQLPSPTNSAIQSDKCPVSAEESLETAKLTRDPQPASTAALSNIFTSKKGQKRLEDQSSGPAEDVEMNGCQRQDVPREVDKNTSKECSNEIIEKVDEMSKEKNGSNLSTQNEESPNGGDTWSPEDLQSNANGNNDNKRADIGQESQLPDDGKASNQSIHSEEDSDSESSDSDSSIAKEKGRQETVAHGNKHKKRKKKKKEMYKKKKQKRQTKNGDGSGDMKESDKEELATNTKQTMIGQQDETVDVSSVQNKMGKSVSKVDVDYPASKDTIENITYAGKVKEGKHVNNDRASNKIGTAKSQDSYGKKTTTETNVLQKVGGDHEVSGHPSDKFVSTQQHMKYNGPQTRSVSDFVDVQFCAIFSSDFIAKETQVPCIQIFDNYFEHKIWQMKSFRKVDDHYCVTALFKVPKKMLQSKKTLYYSYLLWDNYEREYEYFYDRYYKEADNRRKLEIPSRFQDFWIQYDGVVRRVGDPNMVERFINLVTGHDIQGHEKALSKDCQLSAKTFFPSWKWFSDDGVEGTGTEMLKYLTMLHIGLWQTYARTTSFFNTEADFIKFIGKAFYERIKQIIDNIVTSKEPDIISAIGILCVAFKYNIHLDEDSKHGLCRALSLKPDYGSRSCPQIDLVMEQFSEEIKCVTESVRAFINSMKSSKDPIYLCCVPLWHILNGECKAFGGVSVNDKHDAFKSTWWGNTDIKDELEYLKGKSKWKTSVGELLNMLTPLFSVDYLLPRTLMTTLSLEKYDEKIAQSIPMEVIFAWLVYHLRTIRYSDDKIKSVIFPCLEDCSQKLTQHLAIQAEQISRDVEVHSILTSKISVDLLQEVLKTRSKKTGLVVRVIECSLKAFAVQDAFVAMLKQKDTNCNKKMQHLVILSESRKKIINWLDAFSLVDLLDDLKVWNRVLQIELPDGTVKAAVMHEVGDSLEHKLMSEINKYQHLRKKIIDIYVEHFDSFVPFVQEILGKVAFQALEAGCILDDYVFKSNSAQRYRSLLSDLFERSWKKRNLNDPSSILQFSLSWPSFLHFIKMLYQEKKLEFLSENCQIQLTKAASVISDIHSSLLNGNIMVKDLELVLGNMKSFITIAEVLLKQEGKTYNEEIMKKILQLRQVELKKFEEIRKLVERLLDPCQHIQVDTKQLESCLRKLENQDGMKFSELCKPSSIEHITSDIYQHVPTVIYFDITDNVLSELPNFLRCCEGTVFMNILGKQSNAAVAEKESLLSVEELMEQVWLPAFEAWSNLGQKIRSGTIKFREFKRHFKNPDVAFLRTELEHFDIDNSTTWIAERIRQLEEQSILEMCVDGARIIIEVKQAYELEGNFDQITKIQELAEGQDMMMKEMNKSMIDTCEILKDLDTKQVKCLQEFINAKLLVMWLRESMKSLKELKVFVDLASISAGEGDMEVAKVKCLHAATTGYAPLIFNLDKDCDYNKFLEKCKDVWRELDSDHRLPTKLCDTQRELEWLKTVKESHGSVEVTSMYQAEAINSIGIYVVGRKRGQSQNQSTKLTIDDVLELHVQEDHIGSRLRRKYDYKELHELQSKLMLVAGKAEQGKDDVDRFTLILDSIVRLCVVYTKLVAAGCVLFTDWNAKFLCDQKRTVCAFLKFGVVDGCTQLRGGRNATNDVGTVIPKLAKFMENCLEEWLKYIDEKREEYHMLNFFTIDQMVILQRELVKVGVDTEPSILVYPLLSAVKHDCTRADLITAMRLAKADVETKAMEVEENDDDDSMDDTDEEKDNDMDQTNNFIKEMAKACYSENLARQALKHVNPEDIDEGIAWCIEHEEDEEMETELEESSKSGSSVDVQETFTGWSNTGKSVLSVTQDFLESLKQNQREDSLMPDLESLWKNFLSSISSSVSDYLSVEHLGLILQRLAEQDTLQIERTFLQCFTQGSPNLLICPQDEVLTTLLTIYGHEMKQPLPQADEVLLCTSHTTLDEFDIFIRRAIFSAGGRVYCLVNADQLDYEVSDKGERRLEKHMQKAQDQGRQYKLVVVCCTEYEYRSRIVAALDKYRVPPLPLMLSDDIRRYILEKLKVEGTGNRQPAAAVDFERSSVRVVKSWRAGVGKTLYKSRMLEELRKLPNIPHRERERMVSIPLHEREINVDDIMEILLKHTLIAGKVEPCLLHIDIYHEVQEGVDSFLFQLMILGCLSDSSGYVWRKLPCDLYLVETMPILARDCGIQDGRIKCMHKIFDILPDVICRSPQESLDVMNNRKPIDYHENDRLFDEKEFRSAVFQRPFQYLIRLDQGRNLADVAPNQPEGDMSSCLQILLRHCGINDPSWSELKHFVWFLNSQLHNFEVSAYCGPAAAEDLPGFAQFVLRFLIQMSRDFATRSLQISEESTVQTIQTVRMDLEEDEEGHDDLQGYQMRRTWESSPHPYLFFNPDQHSITFLGFNINRQTGDLIDTQTGKVLEQKIMQKNLQDALHGNSVNLSENFDALPRGEKISKLCSVMGTEFPHDPDETYELTTDNVKKILAIYMRFRCDIPVIIMGETGCGKTRLIKFMCSLQSPPGVEVQNMVLMKVHGGTRSSDIIKKVEEAEKKAKANMEEFGQNMFTVLFFDEANTTEAIGLIKEIMCDHSLAGQPIKLCNNLKIVAACNPYRKHSDELIKKLEQAGLGYHVDADKTTDRLGRVPMRRLVYRVQPLPQSMLPLVWDFGQLDTRVEEMYIKQMVLRYIRNGHLPSGIETVISRILTASQEFMRAQADECSFVSLRDVERVLEVMSWFYQQSLPGPQHTILYDLMDEEYDDSEDEMEEEELEEEMESNEPQRLDPVTRSLVLALGVCYHACLKNRDAYRAEVSRHFTPPCPLPGGPDQMFDEIVSCQDVFLENVQLEQKNIAKNQALKENLFMMVVCIELRIPLFLVGKPGSSKSLAKTIVTDAMQGSAAHKPLFKSYKQVQMVSFQCSPLSVPEGIMGTFRQCAMYQKDKDLNRFVSVVVLDEVGLAEDSPRMPLKTLHPLLEDGCQGDEQPEPYKKVAFIGISNWALDPAKMNRGILVQREVPDREDLKETALGICSNNSKIQKIIKPLIEPMADSYLDLFEKVKTKREFFGLRDFYSLLKMVYRFAEKNHKKPSWLMLKHSILRNFGGFVDLDPVEVFKSNMTAINKNERPTQYDPDCTSAGLIQACLLGDSDDSETRYLLLLTENYGALSVLQQKIFTKTNAITIFGSSFPSDQEYTQVCRNINRIKVCMETGNTVVLLNLENLYESLYDALNQYYVYFGGERYVDLGLGTHRVKCRVHKEFRLIVVAEKKIVYEKFPIPLINRLEKHFLTITTLLTPFQLELSKELEDWASSFVKSSPMHGVFTRGKQQEYTIGDVFMGYHDDTCASIILDACQGLSDDVLNSRKEEILDKAKKALLWCATPDSLCRLSRTKLAQEDVLLNKIYSKEQKHDSLMSYLALKIRNEMSDGIFTQVTTHSKLLSTSDIGDLARYLSIPLEDILLLTLQSFDTEQQFCRQLRNCLEGGLEKETILIMQCDSGDQNGSLVACARYCVQDELHQLGNKRNCKVHVVFIIQLPRIAGGCFTGFQCGKWQSVHIDELRPPDTHMPTMEDMRGKSVSALLDNTPYSGHLVKSAVEEMDIEQNEESSDVEMSDDGEVNVDDIVVEEEHYNAGQIPVQRRFNVAQLINTCVHSALSKVKDIDRDTTRNTDRVRILLTLLNPKQANGCDSFLSGLSKHLIALMKEKEEHQSLHYDSNWLSDIASKADDISRAGTFRKTLVQCLADKVTPILAGIIAFLDTNQNLDILVNNPSDTWQHQMWLSIVNQPAATQIVYSMMMSPIQNKALQEAMVRGTRHDGKTFPARMPFSWLFYQLIENAWKTSKDMDTLRDDVSRIKRVSGIIQDLPLGRIISSIQGSIQDMIQAYLCDFVYMIYPVSSQQEHKLVCENLYLGTRAIMADLRIEEERGGVLSFFAAVHVTHYNVATRFNNFSNIHSVWPKCSSAILQLQDHNPQFYMFSDEELTLDVLGLHLMLEENFQPTKETKESLNENQGRVKWLQMVHKFRPVVERILGYFVEESYNQNRIGRRCREGIKASRHYWTRVITMKLFIEHVCTSDEQALTIRRCMPFWVTMKSKSEIDMKELKSLETVEKFLRICHKDVVNQVFGKQERICSACESLIEERPIVLPCNHMICVKCFNDTKIMKTFTCPVCDEHFPEDYKTQDEDAARAKLEQYNSYTWRCNSFFMEVVSQLCFAESTPPSREVINKLLSYITREFRKGQGKKVTKTLTIFDDGLDPTPVFRSFLLQLLIRTSTDDVTQYLNDYLENARSILRAAQEQQSHIVELGLLVIQCLEDSFHQEYSNCDRPSSAEVRNATEMLKRNKDQLMVEELSVEKLYCLAEVRYGLTVTAKYLRIYMDSKNKKMEPTVRRLLDAAGRLCDECGSKWPKLFFVKYICRLFGTEMYQEIYCKEDAPILRWVVVPDLHQNKVVECPDRFIVCGKPYKTLREKLTEAALNENCEKLEESIKKIQSTFRIETQIYTFLALYREVTLSNLQKSQKRFSQQAVNIIKDWLVSHKLFKDEGTLVITLCTNTLWQKVPALNIHQGMDLRQQSIVCLILHFLVMVHHLPGDSTLLEPLKRITKEPQKMKKSMLPTMPQDDVEEIKEALLAARNQGGGDNPVFYRCPNGHLYVIGDCGRPYYTGTCKECGAQIGGQNHNPLPGNEKVDQWMDSTSTGHILGRASGRKPQAFPERKLTSIQCGVLRLLTHIAMFLGANENQQAILEMIKPDIDPAQVFTFLLDHIQVDLDSLKNSLGRSTDDVFLLMHHICHKITNQNNPNEQKSESTCSLLSKEERSSWEDKFSKKYLAPHLQDLENILKTLNKDIVNDRRLGSDPLLCLLFETGSPTDHIPEACLHSNPAVWRYRSQINMKHLSNTFMTLMPHRYPVLRMFLSEEHHLRAIRLIPNIIRLQKCLIQKFQRKLGKQEATALTIADMLQQMDKQDMSVEELEKLIHDFTEAWECARQDLLKFTFPTLQSVATVPKEYCGKPITYKSPVSLLLPTYKEAGLCSYGLLYFLLKKQNTFLENYCKLKKISASSLHKVSVSDLTAAHLISYHPDRDILPMVLANCNYSFEVGKGTKIEYNFKDFERQLTDRFLFSKSLIDITVSQMQIMTYRSETTNAVVFQTLREKIKQEPLTAPVRHQIVAEFRSYPDLCDCLDRLDITISFLKSVGGKEDMKIESFMTQTLKMEHPIPSQQARQSTCCRHAQALWLTLAMQKTKELASYKYEAFEGIGDEFREDLTDNQRGIVHAFCEELQLEKLDILLETLFECIMLRISMPQNPDAEDFVDTTKWSLHDVMAEMPEYDVDIDVPNWLKELIDKMPKAEDEHNIQASQAVDLWLLLYSISGQRKYQRH